MRWLLPTLALLLSGCIASTFSDDATPEPTSPPEPRNGCERQFYEHLVSGYPPLPTDTTDPTTDALVAVFVACSADELPAANARFPIVFGRGPMTYLTGYALFNGTDHQAQHAELCRRPQLERLPACDP